jgi:hypothetical protein
MICIHLDGDVAGLSNGTYDEFLGIAYGLFVVSSAARQESRGSVQFMPRKVISAFEPNNRPITGFQPHKLLPWAEKMLR